MTPLPPGPHVPPSPAVQVVWWLIVLFAVLSTVACLAWSAWLMKVYYRDGRRQRDGLCLKCGYDVRGQPDRCPECGEPIHRRPPVSRG